MNYYIVVFVYLAKRFYSEYLSHEDQANTIFCCHHATLSQSLQYPFKVAQLLCGENVIPETTVPIWRLVISL